ncbi:MULTISPECIES: type II secretion system F family protein [Amycolatopsis]|uniref:Type II secretion system protein GspF domain-containing protein n=1 Tax=Amycolatopsis dongchuanensis TaxID=1070866 RepID=A0ABP9QXA3_9PSEU
MTVTSLTAGACGAGFALGLILIAAGLRRREVSAAPAPSRQWARFRAMVSSRRAAVALVAGIGAAWLTGWLVGGVLVAVAVLSLPRLLGRDVEHAHQAARIEGIAGWAEMLRDTLTAAAGLEQAIVATASTAPEAVRPIVREVALRIERGDHLTPALRDLADDLHDPTADLVVAALVLASEQQTRQLADLLSELAAEAREQVTTRLRIEADRARTRAGVRVIVGTTLTFALGLVIFNRGYLQPFDDAVGQLVLLLVGGLFGFGFWWLRRIAEHEVPERFLTQFVHDREALT